jgi:predicted anti-sigma-YlaC factor YlaD
MNHEECHHLLGSLSEYIDGTLEESLCTEIRKHVVECERCRIVIDTLNKTVTLYRVIDSQVTVPDNVHERLFKRLNLDDFIKNDQHDGM